MLVLILWSILVGLVGGLWWILRRTIPILTANDLPPTIPNDISVVSHLNEEERLIVKSAFYSSPEMRWIVAGKNYEANVDEEQNTRVTDYMMECCLQMAERYGHVLVCRDEKDKFSGTVCLIPPYNNGFMFTIHFLRSILPLGKPVPMRMGKDVAARFHAFNNGCAKAHICIMKGIPHYYVQLLAVAPHVQGKGIGRKLMEAAITVAGDTPIYLDCCDHNVPFYQKVGFSLMKRYTLEPKKIEDLTPFPFDGVAYGV